MHCLLQFFHQIFYILGPCLFPQIFYILGPLVTLCSSISHRLLHSSILLLLSVFSAHTYSHECMCPCVWSPEMDECYLLYHSLPCPVRQDLSLNQSQLIQQGCITIGLQRPLFPPQPWSSNACPALIWMLGIQSQVLMLTQWTVDRQLAPKSEGHFSNASAFWCDTRNRTQGPMQARQPLPLCRISSQYIVSLHAPFQGEWEIPSHHPCKEDPEIAHQKVHAWDNFLQSPFCPKCEMI